MKTKARPDTSARITFREIVESTRVASADILWVRAAQFSKLRHHAKSRHHMKTARQCGEFKAKSLGRLIRLAPDMVKVVPASDSDCLMSVRFRQRGQLHLPPRYIPWM